MNYHQIVPYWNSQRPCRIVLFFAIVVDLHRKPFFLTNCSLAHGTSNGAAEVPWAGSFAQAEAGRSACAARNARRGGHSRQETQSVWTQCPYLRIRKCFSAKKSGIVKGLRNYVFPTGKIRFFLAGNAGAVTCLFRKKSQRTVTFLPEQSDPLRTAFLGNRR